jgi:glycosyltransferase involved in cell wall biosynthesis
MLRKNILHICNNFYGTDAYSNIFKEIRNQSIDSYIIIFMPNSAKNDPQYLKKKDCFKKNAYIIWENIIFHKILKFLPIIRFYRIKKLVCLLNERHKFNLVHSHTLYSNGSIGHLISKFLNIPHIVTVRNVDVNEVFKYLFILKNKLQKILADATSIVFLNPAYMKKSIGIFDDNSDILNKSNVIPSAVDDFWFENLGIKKELPKVVEVLYVGEISPNKNIEFCLNLFINEWDNQNFIVNIIGGTKSKNENIQYLNYLKKKYNSYENINFIGEIDSKNKLLKYYRKSTIFFMASLKETFGLVYFEAMSQGTPVIFTEGQGIDGYFPPGFIGYPVNSSDLNDAKKKVDLILKNYEVISSNCIDSSQTISNVAIISDWIKLYDRS